MKTFDWAKFTSSKITVHCKTEQECANFLKMAGEHGIVWRNNVCPLDRKHFRENGNNICYGVDFEKHVRYESVLFYGRKGFTILEWSDYMEFTKEDLKAGMLVETDCTRMLVMPCENGLFLANKTNWSNLGDSNINKVWGLVPGGACVFDLKEDFRHLLYERSTVKEMTVEEISKALGYDVKIVKG